MKLKHVAVIDDSPEFQQLVHAMFEYMGIHNIEQWTSSEQAKPEVLAVPPQLLLLDVMMSGIDGISLWRTLRREKRTHDLPIIICTAAINSILDKETTLQEDVHTVLLIKPFTLDELRVAIEHLIPHWHA